MTTRTPGFEPFDYGRSMSIFLSDYMYTTPEVAIREMIANSRDQYLHKDTINHPRRNEVYILVDPLHETFRCTDYATGILDLTQFKMMGSNTMGKRVGDRISTVENPDSEIVGQFHVGKASFAKMSYLKEGKVVSFFSNSVMEGHRLNMLIQNTEIGKELGWEDPISRLPADLAHQARPKEEPGPGLSVEVYKVIPQLLYIGYVSNVIANQFGILLSRKQLIVYIKDRNDIAGDWKRIHAPSDLEYTPEKDLLLDKDHTMSHCLEKREDPPHENIRVCVKHIYIKSIHSPHKVTGWINNNRLRLNAARDGFLTDDRSDEMFKYLNPYLDANFERQHTKKSKPKGIKDIKILWHKMIEEALNLYERDPLLLEGTYEELSKIKGKILKTDKENRDDVKKEHGPISRTAKGTEEDNPEGEMIIPLRKRRKRGKKYGGKGTGGGDKETWRTDEESGKERDYLTGQFDNTRPETGSIKPEFNIVEKDIGLDKPVTYMENAHLLYLNTDQPATHGILIMQKHYRQTSIAPLLAEALAEFITRNRPTPTSIKEYRQIVNDIFTRALFSQ